MNRTDYQLIDISEDGFVCILLSLLLFVNLISLLITTISLAILFQVSLLTENGNTKDDLRLPTDDSLLSLVSRITVSVLDINVTFAIYFYVREPENLK